MADAAAVEQLRAVARQSVADEALEAHGLVQDERRPRLDVPEALHAAADDRDAQDAAEHREAGARPLERRGREEARTRRRSLVVRRHGERLHLVAQGVRDAAVRQEHPQPEARRRGGRRARTSRPGGRRRSRGSSRPGPVRSSASSTMTRANASGSTVSGAIEAIFTSPVEVPAAAAGDDQDASVAPIEIRPAAHLTWTRLTWTPMCSGSSARSGRSG